MANSGSGDSLITRLDRILSTFTGTEDTMTSAEIARRADLPTATAHRLCRDMAERGWLDAQESGYAIGTHLWEITNRSSRRTKLAVLARPYMADVQSVVGQHVQLGITDDSEVLFLDRISGRDAPAIHGAVAERLPLHLSATGVVLLAAAAPEAREAYRGDLDPTDATARAACSEERLADVRRRGHCAQTGAIEPGITGIAVPLRDRNSRVIAGLGLVTDQEDVAQRPGPWVQILQIAARGIHRRLADGWQR
ncbi:IclR family transcriptional regulator [Nesterenkonia marinintestina]|uniref:IclR family transcriptional regulator n=1 Tax=Nesterenkonia marinintestina TaxID=2979865 RepID=UPI0021C21175|nr:IclR family transcriptional regulator C-terminal domain-containing protein [Nesterenkonia sp. GX14115]